MIFLYLLLLFCNHSFSLSIGSSSDAQNLTKRDATGDFFPDWVPFKNKHGDELGEFVAVVKRKPKKRLALPASFAMRAQPDLESGDYDDKVQDENTGDDYFEKKDWSNLPKFDNVDVEKSDPAKIADIDGIVSIITNSNEKVEALKEEEKANDEIEDQDKEVTETTQDNKDSAKNNRINGSKEAHKEESDYDYEEKAPAKDNPNKTTDDQSESEAKKAKILDSVDELKERHAKEQRLISEKIKEEEMSKEELERDNLQDSREFDKYNNKLNWRKGNDDYDQYDDKDFDVNDKYKIKNKKSRTRAPIPKTITRTTEKPSENGKISVFTNPHAYLINEYEDSEENPTTLKPKKSKISRENGAKIFSSRYVESVPKEHDSERISLVPQETDSKEGEPTLYFPKKKKNRRRSKTTTTTPEPDSDESADTVEEPERNKHIYLKPVIPQRTSYEMDTTGADAPAPVDTVASAADAAIGALVVSEDPVTDPLPSSTEQKEQKEEKKPENFEYEKGHGGEHHSSEEEEHEEHGKKAYEGKHEETKTAKGHHDKEDHLGKYDDHGGVDKYHHDESGHYGHHHHEEHGKKHAKYEESGKHSKGHSTKGSHDIHKKEEYEKNVEFFEEEGDYGEDEKHGGHHDENGHSKGGNFKRGGLKAEHEGSSNDNKGHYNKGGFGHFNKGHKSAAGHDQHGRQNKKKFVKEGKESGKKWIYHHGHPPRTANLVVIDRRTDSYPNAPIVFS
ncbi:unnamed protein product, partial [Iphiclides podalirius]